MIPQVIDEKYGRFRQYQVNGVMTIGLTDGAEYNPVLVVDPFHQLRYLCGFVNGHRFPHYEGFYAAFGERVQTPIELSSSMAIDLDSPFGSSLFGYILVVLLKDATRDDRPMPMMDSVVDGTGMSYNSANQAATATNVPEVLDVAEKFYIRISRWEEMKDIVQPNLEPVVWGPPLTEEDKIVTQFWSRERIW